MYKLHNACFYAQARIWKFAACIMRAARRVGEKGIPLLDGFGFGNIMLGIRKAFKLKTVKR